MSSKPPFQCKFCGAPSWVAPYDQDIPPDYCHESDHGSQEGYEEYYREYEDDFPVADQPATN